MSQNKVTVNAKSIVYLPLLGIEGHSPPPLSQRLHTQTGRPRL